MHMYFHHNDIKRYLSMSKQNRYLVATIVKEKSESSDDSEEENSVEGIVQQEEDADSNHEHSQDIAIIGDHSHEMLSKSTELIMSMIQQINSRTMEKPDDESGVLFSSLGKNMSNISHDIKKNTRGNACCGWRVSNPHVKEPHWEKNVQKCRSSSE